MEFSSNVSPLSSSRSVSPPRVVRTESTTAIWFVLPISLDAFGLLWEEIQQLGSPELIGIWSTEGYTFDESIGMYDKDHFLGLGLDEDNEEELHDERVKGWTQQVRKELNLSS